VSVADWETSFAVLTNFQVQYIVNRNVETKSNSVETVAIGPLLTLSLHEQRQIRDIKPANL